MHPIRKNKITTTRYRVAETVSLGKRKSEYDITNTEWIKR